MPDHSSIMIPTGCVLSIKTTILIQGRVDLNFMSMQHPLNISDGNASPPKITWKGGAGPVINIIDSTAINIQGLWFNTTTVNTLTRVINIDGDGSIGHQTPTLNVVQYNSFDFGNQSNNKLRIISISATSNNNNENYQISNNDIRCSGTNGTLRATDGVIKNSSTTLTSATAAFVPGDVGKRVRVSYANGILDTTIAERTNGTTVVLAARAVSSQTGATVHIGEAYGTGIYQAGSNAFHTRLDSNRLGPCSIGYDLTNGTWSMTHYGGGGNDVGISAGNSAGTIENFDAEHDMQGIVGGAVISIHRMRGVIDNSVANGWISISGPAMYTIEGFSPESTPPANWTLYNSGGVAKLVSINNRYSPALTFAQVNLCGYANVAFINDTFKSNGTLSGFCGISGLPTSSSGLPSGAIYKNSNVLTVVP
jgi:hypothetical protein